MDEQYGSFFPGETKPSGIVYDNSPAMLNRPNLAREENKTEGMLYDKSFANAPETPAAKEVRNAAAAGVQKQMSEGRQRGMEEGASEMGYESMDELGTEELLIPREAPYGGHDRIKFRDMPNMVRQRIFDAAKSGDLKATLTHYERVLDEYPLVFHSDEDVARAKALIAEGKGLSGPNAKKAFLEKAQKFFDSWRLVARPLE